MGNILSRMLVTGLLCSHQLSAATILVTDLSSDLVIRTLNFDFETTTVKHLRDEISKVMKKVKYVDYTLEEKDDAEMLSAVFNPDCANKQGQHRCYIKKQ